MRGARIVPFLVAAVVVVLDQWTKQWATENLSYRPPIRVIGDFLQLTYTRNSGVAFGLGAGTGFPYYLFSIAAVVIILALFMRRQVHGAGRLLALSLILGGAIGNLIDRLKTGEVVDFIQILWGRFPVFNVADTAVSAGVVLFALTWTRKEHSLTAGPVEPLTHDDTANAGPLSSSGEPRGAAGSLSRDGTDGPLA